MSLKITPIGVLRTVLLLASAISMAVCLPLITLLMFITYRLPLSAFQKKWVCSILGYVMQSLMAFSGEWLCNIKCKMVLSEDTFKNLGSENMLMNWNHRYELDFLTSWIYACRLGMMAGAKTFMKDELRKVPVFGKAWEYMDYLFLKRNWLEDQGPLRKRLERFFEYPVYYTILIFCEGTRFTKEKLAASQEFAISRGIKPLKHHLIPRSKGFVFTIQTLREHMDCYLDITFVMTNKDNMKPNVKNLLLGHEFVCYAHGKRFSIADLPKKDDELAEWLQQRYREKDEDYDMFERTGEFPFGVMHDLPRRKDNLLLAIFCFLFVTLPVCYGIVSFALSLSFWSIVAIATILLLGLVLLISHALSFSLVSRGSAYGKEKKET